MAAPQQENYFQPPALYPTSYPHEQQLPEHEDTKAPYDDLIDQYATPYRQNSQHKSYSVNPVTFNPSEPSLAYSSSHKQTTSDVTSKDLEGSSSQAHDWGYPPPPLPVDKEKPNWLSMVRCTLNPPIPLSLTRHPSSCQIQ